MRKQKFLLALEQGEKELDRQLKISQENLAEASSRIASQNEIQTMYDALLHSTRKPQNNRRYTEVMDLDKTIANIKQTLRKLNQYKSCYNQPLVKLLQTPTPTLQHIQSIEDIPSL